MFSLIYFLNYLCIFDQIHYASTVPYELAKKSYIIDWKLTISVFTSEFSRSPCRLFLKKSLACSHPSSFFGNLIPGLSKFLETVSMSISTSLPGLFSSTVSVIRSLISDTSNIWHDLLWTFKPRTVVNPLPQ